MIEPKSSAKWLGAPTDGGACTQKKARRMYSWAPAFTQSAYYVQDKQFWRCFTSFGGDTYRILAFWRVRKNFIAKFGDFFATIQTLRSKELPGNYRRQRSVLCCSWVVLVCRMATILPDVFLALSAHPLCSHNATHLDDVFWLVARNQSQYLTTFRLFL
jgi:hypothetical protein